MKLFSTKVNKWTNIYHEFESTESGKWIAFGDAYKYEYTDEWFCILGYPIWKIKHEVVNKGLCNIELEDPTESIYEDN